MENVAVKLVKVVFQSPMIHSTELERGSFADSEAEQGLVSDRTEK